MLIPAKQKIKFILLVFFTDYHDFRQQPLNKVKVKELNQLANSQGIR